MCLISASPIRKADNACGWLLWTPFMRWSLIYQRDSISSFTPEEQIQWSLSEAARFGPEAVAYNNFRLSRIISGPGTDILRPFPMKKAEVVVYNLSVCTKFRDLRMDSQPQPFIYSPTRTLALQQLFASSALTYLGPCSQLRVAASQKLNDSALAWPKGGSPDMAVCWDNQARLGRKKIWDLPSPPLFCCLACCHSEQREEMLFQHVTAWAIPCVEAFVDVGGRGQLAGSRLSQTHREPGLSPLKPLVCCIGRSRRVLEPEEVVGWLSLWRLPSRDLEQQLFPFLRCSIALTQQSAPAPIWFGLGSWPSDGKMTILITDQTQPSPLWGRVEFYPDNLSVCHSGTCENPRGLAIQLCGGVFRNVVCVIWKRQQNMVSCMVILLVISDLTWLTIPGD